MSAIYFVDTSALAKRYVVETGSTWTLSWIEPPARNLIIVSGLTMVEMSSVLNRRHRAGELSTTQADNLKSEFMYHFRREYLSVMPDKAILERACDLTETRALRALDAIQLSCALEVLLFLETPLIFVSADRNLLQAASAEGFITDNPNDHP